MSNNSVVEHRANYYYVEFREEFLIICINCSYKKLVKTGRKSAASPHCKALILAILENWTNNKRGKREDLAIFMTYKQWIDAMYGMFGRTVIIDSLDELIGEGLVSKEPYKMPGNKDTYKYRLNYQELNKRLKLLPERDIHDTHPKMDGSTSKPVDPSKSKPDASKNGRVTRPKMDAYPSKSKRNIESYIDSKNIDTTERKNVASQQNPKVASEQEFHSSTHSSPSSQNKNSSQETKPEEVILTEEEQQVYDLACQRFFIARPPEITSTVKEHCAKMAKAGIATLEHIKDLERIARQEQRLGNKPIYLGNLVRGLNGWLQMQNAPVSLIVSTERKAGHVYSSYDDPDYVDDSFYPAKRKGVN